MDSDSKPATTQNKAAGASGDSSQSSLNSDGKNALEKKIYEDVYGTNEVSSFVQAEEKLENARKELEAALKLIPDGNKADYTEAVKNAPHLVEIESSPVRFIRCAEYDCKAAAKLLVGYWRKRKEIFGDRALLPMIQTGEGALAPEDVEVLNSGYGILLPSDAHNRVVVFHDRSRLTAPSMHSLQKRLRCLFYLLSVASECEESRTFGVVTLEDHGEESANSFDGISVKQALELIQGNVFPVRVKAIHLVMKNQSFASNVIPVTLQVLEKSTFLRQRTVVHTGKTGKAILSDLSKYGFRKDGLPASLGGSWLYEERFTQWQAQRKQIELECFYAERGRNIASMPLDKLLQKAVAAREEEKKKRRRAMDALYARRKRGRRKIETEVTEDQVKNLTERNSDLRKKNGVLQDLMQQALQVVAQHTLQDYQNDRKPAAHSPSEDARVASTIPTSIHNFASGAVEHQQQNYATLDPPYGAEPEVQSASYPRSNASSLSSGSAKAASLLPGSFVGQQQQSSYQEVLRDPNVANAFQQQFLRGELKKELQRHDDLLREGENLRQRGLLHEGERREEEIVRQNQMFREGERREENLQQQNDVLRGEEFQQHSQSVRQREKDNIQRQANQTLEVEISRQNQLLQDGEVRHQNQLTRERELQQENQVLRDSIAATARRAKAPDDAHHQEEAGQVDQRHAAQQAQLHQEASEQDQRHAAHQAQQHQEAAGQVGQRRAAQQALQQQQQREQQSLQQHQHQQQQNLQLQQQGQQQQQEKQQKKEQDQQQQRQHHQQHQQQQQQNQQRQQQHQQRQQQQHQYEQQQQQPQAQQHQQQHQQQQQQQHQQQQELQQQQSLSNMISWLQGQVGQNGQNGQNGSNPNNSCKDDSNPTS